MGAEPYRPLSTAATEALARPAGRRVRGRQLCGGTPPGGSTRRSRCPRTRSTRERGASVVATGGVKGPTESLPVPLETAETLLAAIADALTQEEVADALVRLGASI